jgi:GMP synthase PP-ATPase subunit
LAFHIVGIAIPMAVRMMRTSDACYLGTSSLRAKPVETANALENLEGAPSTTKSGKLLAVLLPVRTVGVTGDGRTYDYVCAPRGDVREPHDGGQPCDAPRMLSENVAIGNVSHISNYRETR